MKKTVFTAVIKLKHGDLVRVNRDKIYLIRDENPEYRETIPFSYNGHGYNWQDVIEVENISIRSYNDDKNHP